MRGRGKDGDAKKNGEKEIRNEEEEGDIDRGMLRDRKGKMREWIGKEKKEKRERKVE